VNPATPVITVTLPYHLRNLAGVSGSLQLQVPAPATTCALIDELERTYPELRGTVRDATTGRRRPFVRFFAGSNDLSNDPLDVPLPTAVAEGTETFHIVGAMAGG
jgi:hypothetical protein